MYRGRGEEEHNAATWEFQCTWLSVDSGSGERGGGGVMLMEAGRGRKGPSCRKILGPTGTWEQVEDGKGRGKVWGDAGIGFCKEILWYARNER